MFQLALAAALALTACNKYPIETFSTDYGVQTCALLSECDVLETLGGYESIEECEAIESYDAEGACETYDKAIAHDCVVGITLLSCEDLYAGTWPDTCDKVCQGE